MKRLSKTILSDGEETPQTSHETSPNTTPPPAVTPVPNPKPRKTGFLAWFNNPQDARQIKKINYPQLNDNQHKKNRSGHFDWFYLAAIGLSCVSLSGATLRFRAFFQSYLPIPKTIHLPPNSKIPMTLLLAVKRRTHQVIPLQLNSIFSYPSSFEYPDNSTELPHDAASSSYIYYPPEMDDVVYDEGHYHDYGDLPGIRFIPPDGPQERRIYRDPWETEGRAKQFHEPRDDDVEAYWAFDDDWLRNPMTQFDDDNIQNVHRCRRNNWTRQRFPTGNLLHELDLPRDTPTLVGEGAYREVFIVERPVLKDLESFVLKEIRYDNQMMYDAHEYVRVDALVTERMSSNPQIVNMYAYSGFSILAEVFEHGDVEEDVVGFDDRSRSFNPYRDPELRRYNNFTATQKLKLALAMVQPVAALHHYKDGLIIHDDIQLSQYLWTDETKTDVKLNDFNRAEVMFWDEEYQEYCRFHNGRGGGDWRAPEEYSDKPLNEKIDVWSLGNNFFSLLTGYYPFPNIESTEEIRQKIARGATAKIDPRFYNSSFAEAKLVEVIKRCHVYDPDERADIAEIQMMLENAIAENDKRLANEPEQDTSNSQAASEEMVEESYRSEDGDDDNENVENEYEDGAGDTDAQYRYDEAKGKYQSESYHEDKNQEGGSDSEDSNDVDEDEPSDHHSDSF